MISALASLLYIAATALALTAIEPNPVLRTTRARRAAVIGLAAGLVHAVALYTQFRSMPFSALHFFAAASLVAMLVGVLSSALVAWRSAALFGVVTWPLAAASLIAAAVVGSPANGSAGSNAVSWQIALHAALAIIAYATLSMAALVAVGLVVQERALRHRRVSAVVAGLPPLAAAELLLYRLLGTGFVLLTLALLSGLLFIDDWFTQHLVHKTVLSIAAWIVLTVLLWGRWRLGWRGRPAAWAVIAAMVLLLLGFFGSKFVLELVLHRA